MHADHIDALWRHFTTPRAEGLVEQLRADPHDEALAVLDVSEVEAGPSSSDHGGRYFKVQFAAKGRTRTRIRYIEAKDSMHAGNRLMWRNPSITNAQVVREISREEFERLTKVPL